MAECERYLPDESATVALGEALGALARRQPAGLTLFLAGDLGAGKTTLTRGFLRAFGHAGAVKSPTYTLVEVYTPSERTVCHFDLYRLGEPEELEYMGIRDYFVPGNLCLVEWPERGAGFLPVPDLQVKVSLDGSGRRAGLVARTSAGEQLLAALPDRA